MAKWTGANDRRPQLLVRSHRTYRRPHSLRQALVLIIGLVLALLVLAQAILPRSSAAVSRPQTVMLSQVKSLMEGNYTAKLGAKPATLTARVANATPLADGQVWKLSELQAQYAIRYPPVLALPGEKK